MKVIKKINDGVEFSRKDKPDSEFGHTAFIGKDIDSFYALDNSSHDNSGFPYKQVDSKIAKVLLHSSVVKNISRMVFYDDILMIQFETGNFFKIVNWNYYYKNLNITQIRVDHGNLMIYINTK